MTRYVIINIDNFDGDYPDESLVKVDTDDHSREHLQAICDDHNSETNPHYWFVAEEGYVLQSSFEP